MPENYRAGVAPWAFLGQVPQDYDHVRRVARALVHLAARQLLAAGASPQMVVGQIGEALSKELARANQQGPVVVASA